MLQLHSNKHVQWRFSRLGLKMYKFVCVHINTLNWVASKQKKSTVNALVNEDEINMEKSPFRFKIQVGPREFQQIK